MQSGVANEAHGDGAAAPRDRTHPDTVRKRFEGKKPESLMKLDPAPVIPEILIVNDDTLGATLLDAHPESVNP